MQSNQLRLVSQKSHADSLVLGDTSIAAATATRLSVANFVDGFPYVFSDYFVFVKWSVRRCLVSVTPEQLRRENISKRECFDSVLTKTWFFRQNLAFSRALFAFGLICAVLHTGDVLCRSSVQCSCKQMRVMFNVSKHIVFRWRFARQTRNNVSARDTVDVSLSSFYRKLFSMFFAKHVVLRVVRVVVKTNCYKVNQFGFSVV